jgi:hypothetical protein
MRAAVGPQREAMTVAHVYGTEAARLIPLITLTVVVALAWKVFRRAEPYLAELT